MAFLELPGIELTSEIARSRTQLRRALRRQQAKERFISTSGSVRPPEDLTAYSGEPLEDGGLTRLVASIYALYSRMRPGDIVITPGFELVGKYRRPIVHFGEITSDFDPNDIFAGPTASSDKVPFRRVKWLNKVQRRELPPALEVRIGRPPAVRQIEITDETAPLLDFTYSNYIFDSGSSSLVEASRYTGEKFGALNDSSRLIELLTAAYAYAQTGGQQAHIGDLRSFRNEYFARSGVENIQIEFASPGFWRIIGGTATLGAFVALGITLLSSGIAADALQDGIVVMNSASASVQESKEIQDSMNIFLDSLTQEQLKELQEDATRAKDEIGLTSPVKIVK